MNRQTARKRKERKAYRACPVTFGASLIKEHGEEKARAMFIEATAEFDGEKWRDGAGPLFDKFCARVASGDLTIMDGGVMPQELVKATLSGAVPSNASAPGPARDVAMAALEPPTQTRH
ncbi:MAG TPA: hypothetical protein VN742_09595 [Candidatus Binataceae bacterium]|nr:hypothetical protein [Candidatus Binataceae bacterium]